MKANIEDLQRTKLNVCEMENSEKSNADAITFLTANCFRKKQLALWQMRNRLCEFLIASSHNMLRNGEQYD